MEGEKGWLEVTKKEEVNEWEEVQKVDGSAGAAGLSDWKDGDKELEKVERKRK